MAFYPQAIQRPGPPIKVGGQLRSGKGAVLHSAEGYLAGIFKTLDLTTGLPKDWQKSWHFTIALDGTCYQHYDSASVCWHAGSTANLLYVGIEHEGVAGTPETDEQVAADAKLLGWLGGQEDWPRFEVGSTLHEHNEFMATACPSSRIRWTDIQASIPVPVPAWPDAGDFALSLASAIEFRRRGWLLKDLGTADKANIRWAASQL